MARKKDTEIVRHTCGECGLGVFDTKHENLSLEGKPTLVSCPNSGRFKRVVSEFACKDFVLRLAFAVLLLSSCTPTKRVYRVEFGDGTYDYYELDYRPKQGDKHILYEGETILGVEKVEQIKN